SSIRCPHAQWMKRTPNSRVTSSVPLDPLQRPGRARRDSRSTNGYSLPLVSFTWFRSASGLRSTCAFSVSRHWSLAPEIMQRRATRHPLGTGDSTGADARLSNFSADSRLTLGRCPRPSSATSRGLTPARLASSFLLRLNCLRAVLSNGPRLSDSMSSPWESSDTGYQPRKPALTIPLRANPFYVPPTLHRHRHDCVDTRRYREGD